VIHQNTNNFRDAFDKVIESAGASDSALGGNEYVAAVETEIDKMVEAITKAGSKSENIHSNKGFIAEEWHGGTFNTDRVAKGSSERVSVQRSNEFASPDLKGSWGQEYGSKYYKDGQSSAQAQAKTYFQHYRESTSGSNEDISFSDFYKNKGIDISEDAMHKPIYGNQTRIIPSDQTDEVSAYLNRKISEESAKRPEQVERYQNTRENSYDSVLSPEGGKSIPLSEKDAVQMSRDVRDGEFDPQNYNLTPRSFVEWSDILRETGKGAMNAAILTAVLKSAPHLADVLKDILSGNDIDKEKIKDLGESFISGGIEGSLRGGVAAFVTISCKTGLLGESLKSVSPNAVAVATVIAMNTIKNAIKLHNQEITQEKFIDNCMRDTFIIAAGVAAGTFTQGLIPVPVLGMLIGNFVGSVLAVIVYDGSKSIFLSLCIKYDISFFCLVKQDYSLPKEILEASGFELIDLEEIELEEIDLEEIELETIELETIDIKVLKRGLIAVNTIGYSY
jgi:hypothetical protein